MLDFKFQHPHNISDDIKGRFLTQRIDILSLKISYKPITPCLSELKSINESSLCKITITLLEA